MPTLGCRSYGHDPRIRSLSTLRSSSSRSFATDSLVFLSGISLNQCPEESDTDTMTALVGGGSPSSSLQGSNMQSSHLRT